MRRQILRFPTRTPPPEPTATPSATTTQTPTPEPVAVGRPAPIPFVATSLRDSMNFVRSQIEQMGGVLDRMYNGEPGRGGRVSQLNYGAGRQGINASLDRLIPAIEMANSLIGG